MIEKQIGDLWILLVLQHPFFHSTNDFTLLCHEIWGYKFIIRFIPDVLACSKSTVDS